MSFGFGSVYMRFFSRYIVEKDEVNIAKLNGMCLIIFFGVGLVAVIVGTVLFYNTNLIFGNKLTIAELISAEILMGIMVPNIALSFPACVFNSYTITVVNPFIMLPVLLMG